MQLISGAIGFFTASLLMLSLPANSDEGKEYMQSGNYLLTACKQALNATDTNQRWTEQATYCVSYITGYIAGSSNTTFALWVRKYGPSSITPERAYSEFGVVCMPDNVTNAQIERVVVRYLDNHPSDLNKSSGFLMMQALQDAWPCKPKTK